MKIRRTCIKIISIFLAVALFVTNVAFAHLPETTIWSERRPSSLRGAFSSDEAIPIFNGKRLLQPNDGFAMTPYCTIRKVLRPKPSFAKASEGKSQTIIHIQDIHQNLEAQTNISKALQRLMEGNEVGLVALEGSSGPIDLSEIHHSSRPNTLHAVADYLLKENRISGPIHAALNSGRDLPKIIGIDDADHYRRNVQAVKDSAPKKNALLASISAESKSLQIKKEKSLNPELLEFDRHVEDYRAGRLSFASYARLLGANSPALTLALKMFLDALAMETTLDFSKVESERNAVVSRLLSDGRATGLMEMVAAFRNGQMRNSDFFAAIGALCAKQRVPLERYPHFKTYLGYVALSETIDVEAVHSDMRNLEAAGYAARIRTADEKKLIEDSRRLWLEGKLVEFALTKEEWAEYKNARSANNFAAFKSFYREAEIRDDKMAENFLKQILGHRSQTLNSKNILVTGGFHSAGIDQRLVNAGFTVISAVPRVTKIDSANGSAYLSTFTQEKSPLEKLFEGQKLFLAADPVSPFEQKIEIPLLSHLYEKATAGKADGQSDEQVRMGEESLDVHMQVVNAEIAAVVEQTPFRTLTLAEFKRWADRVLEGKLGAREEFERFGSEEMANGLRYCRDLFKRMIEWLGESLDDAVIDERSTHVQDLVGLSWRYVKKLASENENEKKEVLLREFHRSIRFLNRLTNQIWNLRKTGSHGVVDSSLDLGRILLDQILMQKTPSSKKYPGAVKFNVDIPNDLPLVAGIKTEIEYVFQETLKDAASSTRKIISRDGKENESGPVRATGEVHIKARYLPESGANEIIIEDNGIGMSRETLEKIGKYGVSINPLDQNVRFGGAGIGLAQSIDIVREHGGTFKIESEPSWGARVTITLPVSQEKFGPAAVIFPPTGGDFGPLKNLVEVYPMARNVVDQVNAAANAYRNRMGVSFQKDFDVLDVVLKLPSDEFEEKIHRETGFSYLTGVRLATLAHQLALWEIFKSKNKTIEVVSGMSQGEIAAIYAAGGFTIDQSVRTTIENMMVMEAIAEVYRGLRFKSVSGLDVPTIQNVLTLSDRKFYPKIKAAIAIFNSPTLSVVSAEEGQWGDLKENLLARGGKVTDIDFKVTTHHPDFDLSLKELAKPLQRHHDYLSGLEKEMGEPALKIALLSEQGTWVSATKEIIRGLAETINHPVRWDLAMREIQSRHPDIARIVVLGDDEKAYVTHRQKKDGLISPNVEIRALSLMPWFLNPFSIFYPAASRLAQRGGLYRLPANLIVAAGGLYEEVVLRYGLYLLVVSFWPSADMRLFVEIFALAFGFVFHWWVFSGANSESARATWQQQFYLYGIGWLLGMLWIATGDIWLVGATHAAYNIFARWRGWTLGMAGDATNKRAPVLVRWMTKPDMPAVLKIEQASFEHSWPERTFLGALKQKNITGMVAERNNQIIGFMLYELQKSNLQVLNFAVAPEWRRQGVGYWMVTKLIANLSYHRPKITLVVRDTNLAAQLFFRAHGFEATKVLWDFYEDSGDDGYVMDYELPSGLMPINPFSWVYPWASRRAEEGKQVWLPYLIAGAGGAFEEVAIRYGAYALVKVFFPSTDLELFVEIYALVFGFVLHWWVYSGRKSESERATWQQQFYLYGIGWLLGMLWIATGDIWLVGAAHAAYNLFARANGLTLGMVGAIPDWITRIRIDLQQRSKQILFREEERLLLGRHQQAGDNEKYAIESLLVDAFQPLIMRCAKIVAKLWKMSFADAMQEGNLAFLQAVRHFDLSFNTRLQTYAEPAIKHALSKSNVKERKSASPANFGLYKREFKKAKQELKVELGRTPTKTEIKLRLEQQGRPLSHSNQGVPIEPFIFDPETVEPVDISKFLKLLDRREQIVLKMRLGFGNAEGKSDTLEIIGDHFSITKERVRQIEAESLSLIRAFVEDGKRPPEQHEVYTDNRDVFLVRKGILPGNEFFERLCQLSRLELEESPNAAILQALDVDSSSDEGIRLLHAPPSRVFRAIAEGRLGELIRSGDFSAPLFIHDIPDNIKSLTEVSDRIQAIRRFVHLTQGQMAGMLGMERQTYGKNERNPSAFFRIRFADHLIRHFGFPVRDTYQTLQVPTYSEAFDEASKGNSDRERLNSLLRILIISQKELAAIIGVTSGKYQAWKRLGMSEWDRFRIATALLNEFQLPFRWIGPLLSIPSPDEMNLGQRLQWLRLSLNLDLREMANAAETNLRRYRRWELGEPMPQKNRRRLARYLIVLQRMSSDEVYGYLGLETPSYLLSIEGIPQNYSRGDINRRIRMLREKFEPVLDDLYRTTGIGQEKYLSLEKNGVPDIYRLRRLSGFYQVRFGIPEILLNRYLGIPSPEEVVDSIRGKSFREMLPVLLDYSGDSLWTLAANAGVSREGIEKWLKGTTPTLNSMRKVASYFATRHRFPSADLLDAFEGLYGLESPESLMPTVEGSADFGRALRAIHLGRKYSFNDIARATDVDPRTARGWEYNGTYPSAEEFGKLLHYLCDIQRFNRHSLEPTLRRLWGGPSHEVRSVPQVNEIALPTGLMPINPFAWRYPHSSRPDAVAMTGGFFEEIAVRYLVQILLFSSAMGLSSWLSVILFAVFFATVFHPKMFIGKKTQAEYGWFLSQRLKLFVLSALLGGVGIFIQPYSGTIWTLVILGVGHGLYNPIARRMGWGLGMASPQPGPSQKMNWADITWFWKLNPVQKLRLLYGNPDKEEGFILDHGNAGDMRSGPGIEGLSRNFLLFLRDHTGTVKAHENIMHVNNFFTYLLREYSRERAAWAQPFEEFLNGILQSTKDRQRQTIRLMSALWFLSRIGPDRPFVEQYAKAYKKVAKVLDAKHEIFYNPQTFVDLDEIHQVIDGEIQAITPKDDDPLVEVRAAKTGDLSAIVQLDKETKGIGWPANKLAQLVHDRSCPLQVVVHNDRVVGFIFYEFLKKTLRVNHIALAKDYQDTMLGFRLLNELEAIAEKSGRTKLFFTVRESTSIEMLRRYQRWGFEIPKVKHGYYRDTGEDAYFLSPWVPPNGGPPHSIVYNSAIFLGAPPYAALKAGAMILVPFEVLGLLGILIFNGDSFINQLVLLTGFFLLDFVIGFYGHRARGASTPIMSLLIFQSVALMGAYIAAIPFLHSVDANFIPVFLVLTFIHGSMDFVILWWQAFVNLVRVHPELWEDPEFSELNIDGQIYKLDRIVLNNMKYEKYFHEKDTLTEEKLMAQIYQLVDDFKPDSEIMQTTKMLHIFHQASFNYQANTLNPEERTVLKHVDALLPALVPAEIVAEVVEQINSTPLVGVFAKTKLLINQPYPTRYRWGRLRIGGRGNYVPIQLFANLKRNFRYRLAAFSMIFAAMRRRRLEELKDYERYPWIHKELMDRFDRKWNRKERRYRPWGFPFLVFWEYFNEQTARYQLQNEIRRKFWSIYRQAVPIIRSIEADLRSSEFVGVNRVVDRFKMYRKYFPQRDLISTIQTQLFDLIDESEALGHVKLASAISELTRILFLTENAVNPAKRLRDTMTHLARTMRYPELIRLVEDLSKMRLRYNIAERRLYSWTHLRLSWNVLITMGLMAGLRHFFSGGEDYVYAEIFRDEIVHINVRALSEEFDRLLSRQARLFGRRRNAEIAESTRKKILDHLRDEENRMRAAESLIQMAKALAKDENKKPSRVVREFLTGTKLNLGLNQLDEPAYQQEATIDAWDKLFKDDLLPQMLGQLREKMRESGSSFKGLPEERAGALVDSIIRKSMRSVAVKDITQEVVFFVRNERDFKKIEIFLERSVRIKSKSIMFENAALYEKIKSDPEQYPQLSQMAYAVIANEKLINVSGEHLTVYLRELKDSLPHELRDKSNVLMVFFDKNIGFDSTGINEESELNRIKILFAIIDNASGYYMFSIRKYRIRSLMIKALSSA